MKILKFILLILLIIGLYPDTFLSIYDEILAYLILTILVIWKTNSWREDADRDYVYAYDEKMC